MADKKQDSSKCCEGCVIWEQHGKACWVYWEGKKYCTQHATDWSKVQQR